MAPSLADTQTLGKVLRKRAGEHPSRVAFTFLSNGETESGALTYAELDRQAAAIGAALKNSGAEGRPVLLLFPSGLHYVAAIFGCFYSGAVAVPTYPPRPGRADARMAGIAADSGAGVALTTSALLPALRSQFEKAHGWERMHWIATDLLLEQAGWDCPPVAIEEDKPALLQYTSGSTSAPRGVIVTHANLLATQRMLQAAFEHCEDSTHVSWLPIFHDMGLANVLNPVFLGATCFLMQPATFVQRPMRWLRMISRHRASTSMAPNFAYDLCARAATAEDIPTLDLSSWTLALNGAEPVRHATLERFAATFAPCGFRRETFYPAYGLAEATVFVTGGPKWAEPPSLSVSAAALARHSVVPAAATDPQSRTFVGCGKTWMGTGVRIVDPDTMRECEPDRIGEIWVAGPQVAQGYWRNPVETAASFGARLSDTGEGPFLRTGDLGFIRSDQLYITGRLKNVIVVDGRNCYAEDIEQAALESHPALRPGHCAAFAVDVEDQERLVIVAEIDRRYRPAERGDAGEIILAIRRSVAEIHDVTVYAVAPVSSGSIPMTSSGKVQRHGCARAYLAGTLKPWEAV